ncbi:MAG: hypothetical protein AAGA48_18075 [Myxococcota bacterium]
MKTVFQALAAGAEAYADLDVFRAVRDDRIPVDAFPSFFVEQAMAARWFQDFIWAGTAIEAGPLAAFAAAHRRRDSGHYRWSERDLARFGLPALDLDAAFALDRLDTRIQLARILALFHEATTEMRLVVLLALERAGDITLSTLNGYVHRHGLAERTHYLGDAHVAVEEDQAARIAEALGPVLASSDPQLLETVRITFDALSRMFADGGSRHWSRWMEAA